jgi:hypothetical protein
LDVAIFLLGDGALEPGAAASNRPMLPRQ